MGESESVRRTSREKGVWEHHRAADWREERRKRAWERKQAGWSQKEIAEALGVREGAISQWMKSARAGGGEALKAHPAPGARPKRSAEQQAHIPAVLAKGASASGCAGEVWNSRRLAVALKRAFGVSAHPDHCGYLVRKMGDRMQKPIERATQRNEQAMEVWKTQQWPRQKKPNKNSARSSLWMKQAFLCCR
ncbi:MAG TPA: winged helix-turn-helix domain-containing protein [Ktedonobacteraceae bacterium]